MEGVRGFWPFEGGEGGGGGGWGSNWSKYGKLPKPIFKEINKTYLSYDGAQFSKLHRNFIDMYYFAAFSKQLMHE